MDDKDLLVLETRQLLTDVEEAAKDGRLLAHQLTETIENIIKLQCEAIENRVKGLIARIDAAEQIERPPTH